MNEKVCEVRDCPGYGTPHQAFVREPVEPYSPGELETARRLGRDIEDVRLVLDTFMQAAGDIAREKRGKRNS